MSFIINRADLVKAITVKKIAHINKRKIIFFCEYFNPQFGFIYPKFHQNLRLHLNL